MSERKLTTTLLVILICVSAVLAARYVKDRRAEGWVSGAASADSRVKGNPQADIRIIEHIDYQCGACKQASQVLAEYQQKYPDRFQIAVRLHPLDGHRHGLTSAVWAECASRQNKFWKFHDLLFSRQSEWSKLDDPRSVFRQIAKDAGLDEAALGACVNQAATQQKVKNEKAVSQAQGVSSTPTFFLNGKRVVGFLGLQKELKALFPNEKRPASGS